MAPDVAALRLASSSASFTATTGTGEPSSSRWLMLPRTAFPTGVRRLRPITNRDTSRARISSSTASTGSRSGFPERSTTMKVMPSGRCDMSRGRSERLTTTRSVFRSSASATPAARAGVPSGLSGTATRTDMGGSFRWAREVVPVWARSRRCGYGWHRLPTDGRSDGKMCRGLAAVPVESSAWHPPAPAASGSGSTPAARSRTSSPSTRNPESSSRPRPPPPPGTPRTASWPASTRCSACSASPRDTATRSPRSATGPRWRPTSCSRARWTDSGSSRPRATRRCSRSPASRCRTATATPTSG